MTFWIYINAYIAGWSNIIRISSNSSENCESAYGRIFTLFVNNGGYVHYAVGD